ILGLMIYNRRNWQSYILWQISMVLISIIPIVLYLMGIERNEYLAFLPMALSLSIFVGTMIIGDRRARTELKRRFHIN
ncbi:MAG: zinc ribbon domain-containing protein, partial [Lachnospiraceae bacterium]|nr:zinc ribbon domain-containing protein [Lachnospiraceae bacterium]